MRHRRFQRVRQGLGRRQRRGHRRRSQGLSAQRSATRARFSHPSRYAPTCKWATHAYPGTSARTGTIRQACISRISRRTCEFFYHTFKTYRAIANAKSANTSSRAFAKQAGKLAPTCTSTTSRECRCVNFMQIKAAKNRIRASSCISRATLLI